VFAQFADVAAISWYLGFFGEAGAFLFLLYIWVTLGSGFRFGPKYLISELAMSVVGFGAVIYVNDFWRAHLSLGVGMLIGMTAVSLYVLSLVRRMFEALAARRGGQPRQAALRLDGEPRAAHAAQRRSAAWRTSARHRSSTASRPTCCRRCAARRA
jgi:two-component system sensor histidine kinase RpfC